MSYIRFDKKQLVNLESSLQKEILRSNRAGSYLSTTIVGCNTRKYHGLLVSLQPQINNHHHVLLSALDETIIQHETEFNLGIHKYTGDVYEPGGHKYMHEFESDPIPTLTYKVGGVVFTKERVFAANEDRILIRYKLVDAHSPTVLRFKPFLTFRSVHSLSKANSDVNTGYSLVSNGIGMKLYEPYSTLYMQFSKDAKYVHNPNWYFGIEYPKEMTRGYDFKEDLFVPGYFEIAIKKGESIIFSGGLEKADPSKLKTLFIKEFTTRIPRDNFEDCLINSAQQFFVHRKKKIDLIAGYHWFDISGRDTFIALPGLTLTQNDTSTFIQAIDTMVCKLRGAFFPNSRVNDEFVYNSVDAPLWFFWSLQQYAIFTGDHATIWKKYKKVMSTILEEFRKGTSFNVHMLDNGLLWAGTDNDVLTWMNVQFDGKPFINRSGLAVEINALWFNAINFYIELARRNKEKDIVSAWQPVIDNINGSFISTFWSEKQGYLADVVRGDYRDFSARPNQIFATSLPYRPIPDEICHRILVFIEKELLTTRGLRTLSPKHPDYKGIYKGDIVARDTAYHQGSVFPWLLGAFADGYLNIHGKGGLGLIKKLYKGFEEEMGRGGIGTISELYYGDPPHKGKGAISQAWSVAELLRINHLIKKFG
jgi:predicted glycogen debranching enzyme